MATRPFLIALMARLRLAYGPRSTTRQAEALGMSKQHWSQVRRGERYLPMNALLHALGRWPDLAPVLVEGCAAALRAGDNGEAAA